MGRHAPDPEKHNRVECPKCHHWSWVPKSSRSNRCEQCTPPKICPRCGMRYKLEHNSCKRNGREVLYAETGQRPLKPLKQIGPKDRHRFASVVCCDDGDHIHIADITNTRMIHARCDRRKVATMVLKCIPLSCWGIMDEKNVRPTPSYHGPWCRRCYALVLRLLGDKEEFQVSVYEKP
jgi:hypothetical protein